MDGADKRKEIIVSKRDNPRRKQREEEKQKKRQAYSAGAGAARAQNGRGGRAESGLRGSEGGRGESRYNRSDRLRREYAPREPRPLKTLQAEEAQRQKTVSGFVENPNLIAGRNPVMEAVKSGRTIDKILMQKDGEGSIRKIASLARERGLQIQYVDRIALDRLTGGRSHQGVAAFVSAYSYCQVEDILRRAQERGEDPFVILLDGIEDPHNLGAIMRTADAAGAHGIIIPARRAVGLTETAAKASAGAIEYVPVAKVSSIAAAIEQLQEQGLWIGACDMDGQEYTQAQLTGPIGLVVGGEGQGVGRLVRQRCDFVLSIPMAGSISSLNASNAAAILMYEVVRRRRSAQGELK